MIFYQLADAQRRIEAAGFRCVVYGGNAYPVGALEREHQEMGRLTGLRAARYTARLGESRLSVASCELLDLLKRDDLDGIVSDEVMAIGRTLGEVLEIPVVTIANALPLRLETAVPPPLVGWSYRDSFLTHCRNRAVNFLIDQMARPGLRVVNRFRMEHRLPAYRSLDALASPLAHICQLPAAFDFPRKQLPSSFHYAGPFDSFSARPAVDFSFDQLSDLPLIYVSFGTLQNRVIQFFQTIARVIGNLPVQAIMSLGGGRDPSEFTSLPSNVKVVKYAPQTDLLQRASLCVTHAGMNTTLECLAHGVPMLAIPVTNDQPAVAAQDRASRSRPACNPCTAPIDSSRGATIDKGLERGSRAARVPNAGSGVRPTDPGKSRRAVGGGHRRKRRGGAVVQDARRLKRIAEPVVPNSGRRTK